jgi:hypothetical protein
VIPIQDIDFSELSAIDRILLAQELLASIIANNIAPPTTPQQRMEIERGAALVDAAQMGTSTWTEARARLTRSQ